MIFIGADVAGAAVRSGITPLIGDNRIASYVSAVTCVNSRAVVAVVAVLAV